MNQVREPFRLAAVLRPDRAETFSATDPITAATAAIERILAAAHEAGQDEAVRILHAVTALLSATPRH